jgi:hypothetical protein
MPSITDVGRSSDNDIMRRNGLTINVARRECPEIENCGGSGFLDSRIS